MSPKSTSTTVVEPPATPAQIVQRLTARSGRIPEPGGFVPRLQPELYEGRLVALQALGFVAGRRARLDVRVRVEVDGQVEDHGVRRVHLVHHIKQFSGLRVGEWSVGRFERMHRHGHQWAALPHKGALRA
ncbi:hypothetical protein [Streptomyces purpureus]|uniref:hypothetical protein n=1 Tax=Streptomyces purpureus TaxID=1951 RepID=UPI0003692BEF|nr:hypothetical protein [Streptomyces purpureus]